MKADVIARERLFAGYTKQLAHIILREYRYSIRSRERVFFW